MAAVIIARSGPWLDAMSLQKLLYYVQAWHLAITDEPLFGERIKAYRDGPVVPEVWQARRGRQTRRAVDQDIEGIALDAETSDLIDLVLTTYGSMSGDEALEVWTSSHIDTIVRGKASQPAAGDPTTGHRGLGWDGLSRHSRVLAPAQFIA